MFLKNKEVTTTELGFDPKNLEVNPNFNMNAAQAQAGLVAKIQVRYKGFSFIANLWEKNNRKWLTTPSQKGTKNFFALVALNKPVVDHIVKTTLEMQKGVALAPWYLNYAVSTAQPNDACTNEDLGILDISYDTNLSDNQRRSGMICKVTIDTPIGKFYSLTIFKSKFAGLFSTIPQETAREEGQRGMAGYSLDRAVQAQVLKYVHAQVDWSVPDEIIPEAPKAEEKPADEAVADALKPTGNTPEGFSAADLDEGAMFGDQQ